MFLYNFEIFCIYFKLINKRNKTYIITFLFLYGVYMQRQTSAILALDASAITLSGLCLIHCLLLPVIAIALPIAVACAHLLPGGPAIG